jgi:hypothetical protein
MAIKSVGWFVYEPISGDNTSAWAAAVATGRPLWTINNGNKVQLASAPTVGNRDFIVKTDPGVIFETTANAIMFNIIRGLGTSYAITALDNVEYDASEGDSITSTVTRLRLTSGDGANIVVGDYYKIASEDVAPGGSSGENPRMGEIVQVIAKETSGADVLVYLSTTVYREDLYVTTPTISRMNGQDYVTDIQGMTFRMGDAGVAGAWNLMAIWCEGSFNARIDATILRGANSGIYLQSNYKPQIKADIRHVQYQIGAIGGYGVWVSSDNYGRYQVTGGRCRHLFTDNWAPGHTGSVMKHGPMIGATVTGTASYCSGAGFDFHSSAYNCQMVNPTSIGNYEGRNQGLGAGIQLRGFKNRVIGAKTYNNEWGCQVFANSGTASDDLTVEGLESDDKKGSIIIDGQSALATRMMVRIKGGTLRFQSARGVVIQDANVRFEDTVFMPKGQSGGVLLDLDGNNNIRGNIKCDLRDAAGAWTLADLSGTNEVSVHTTSDDADATPGDAAYVVTDTTPDEVLFSTTLTADRAVTFSVQSRKRVLIRRTAAGAFNLNVSHAGGTLALAQNRAAWFTVRAGVVMLDSPTMTIA